MPKKATNRKAANGQGSTRWNDKLNRYEYRMTVGQKPDGTIIRKMVTGKTQEQLQERIADLKRSVAVDPSLPSDMTVRDFLTYWVDQVLPLANVTRKTREGYAYNVQQYVNPYVGHVALKSLTPAHVRQMVLTLKQQGKSANTQRLARATLRRALATAESDGLIPRNVVALTDGVPLGHRERRYLTPEQAKQLVTYLDGHELEAAVLVMLSLGLRRGELAGLTWDDMQLPETGNQGGLLKVVRAVIDAADGSLYVDSTKNTRSRTLHIPAPLVDVLRSHRARQNEARLVLGTGWGAMFPEYRWVFTNPVGNPMDGSKLNKDLKAVTIAAGIGTWNPHALRHSAASLLQAQGVHAKVIQETLGHSSIQVTMDVYTHLFDDARKEAADSMTSALWG